MLQTRLSEHVLVQHGNGERGGKGERPLSIYILKRYKTTKDSWTRISHEMHVVIMLCYVCQKQKRPCNGEKKKKTKTFSHKKSSHTNRQTNHHSLNGHMYQNHHRVPNLYHAYMDVYISKIIIFSSCHWTKVSVQILSEMSRGKVTGLSWWATQDIPRHKGFTVKKVTKYSQGWPNLGNGCNDVAGYHHLRYKFS